MRRPIPIPAWEPGGQQAAFSYSRMFVMSGDRGLIASGLRTRLADAGRAHAQQEEP